MNISFTRRVFLQAGGLAASAAARFVASLGPRLKVDETRAVLQHFLETNGPVGK